MIGPMPRHMTSKMNHIGGHNCEGEMEVASPGGIHAFGFEYVMIDIFWRSLDFCLYCRQ